MFYCWSLLYVCLFVVLCSAISPNSLGRLPWNFGTWLEMCALRQCRPQNVGSIPEKFCKQLLFLHLGAKSPSSIDRNFVTWSKIGGGLKVRSKNLGVPRKKMWGMKNSKKLAHNLAIRVNNFAASPNKLVHVMCRKTGMNIWIKKFLGPAPLKFAGAISENFRFRSRISPERIEILTSGKRRYQLQSLPRSTRKSCKLWSTNKVYAANVFQRQIVHFWTQISLDKTKIFPTAENLGRLFPSWHDATALYCFSYTRCQCSSIPQQTSFTCARDVASSRFWYPLGAH